MADTMQAAVIREHGDFDKVRVEEVAKPGLEHPDDVIVRVRACALNRLDLFFRKGASGPGLRPIHLPRITGVDIAGEVAEVGSAVTDWQVGDRVVVYPSLSCGHCRACEQGEHSMCPEYRIFGEDTNGGLAEYCRIWGGAARAFISPRLFHRRCRRARCLHDRMARAKNRRNKAY